MSLIQYDKLRQNVQYYQFYYATFDCLKLISNWKYWYNYKDMLHWFVRSLLSVNVTRLPITSLGLR